MVSRKQERKKEKRRRREKRERMEGNRSFISQVARIAPYAGYDTVRYSMGGTRPEAAVSHLGSIHSPSTIPPSTTASASSTHPSFQARVSYRVLWINALVGRVGSSKAVAVWVQCQCTPGSDHNHEDLDPDVWRDSSWELITFISEFQLNSIKHQHLSPTLLSRAIRDIRCNTPLGPSP